MLLPVVEELLPVVDELLPISRTRAFRRSASSKTVAISERRLGFSGEESENLALCARRRGIACLYMLSASVTLFAAAAFLAACVSDLPVGVVAIVWFNFLFVVCGVVDGMVVLCFQSKILRGYKFSVQISPPQNLEIDNWLGSVTRSKA